jgi:hypothetical protein
MVVDKYDNHARKFMWQPCGWGRVDIYMTFHMCPFDFFYAIAPKKMSTPSYPVAT